MIDFEFSVWFYCSLLAAFVPILIPYLQFGVIFRIWDVYNKPVNKDHCQCSCWDTVFKAGYETGVGSYKHVYFNATKNSFIIWTFTVLSLICFYEATRKVFSCLYKGQARPRMCLLYLSVIFPHYYGWWSYFNYFNDDFYKQFWHQLFFTITELISTATVLHLIDINHRVTPKKIVLIISIAILHILASGWDQFAENVLRQEGQLHQVLRDFGFMIPDLFHVYIPWQELKDVAKKRGIPPSHLIRTEEFLMAVFSIVLLWLLAALIQG